VSLRLLISLSTAFVVGAGVFAVPAIPAIAQESASTHLASADDGDGFVRFEQPGREATFSTVRNRDVVSRAAVTKIGFGKTSTVDILTTPAGSYSSDAVFSPNVRYPGVNIRPTQSASNAGGLLSFWQRGLGWISMPLSGANSFVLLTRPSKDSKLITTEEGNCFVNGNGVFC